MKNLLRNVAYASVIIAALAITTHQFNRPAEATFATTCIVNAGQGAVLTSEGKFVELDSSGWFDLGYPVVPISPSQVAYILRPQTFIDTNGDGWQLVANQWVNFGPPPCDMPINTEPTTWGAIKAREAGK